MDFIKMIMELPGEKRAQDVIEHVEWNHLWKQIVTQGNHSEDYLPRLYDYLFNREGWIYKVQAELDGVQPYLEGVMTQPVGKAPDGSLWTYPSSESGTVPWGNIMGDITRQQDLIQKLDTKAEVTHKHNINTLTFNEGDINGSWVLNGTISESAYGAKSVPTSALKDLSVTSDKLANTAVINAKIANGAVSTGKIATGAISREKLAADTKVLSFTNRTIDTSAWASDTIYTDFSYRAAVACEGVTVNHYVEVTFAPVDSMSGVFAPVVESYNGGIYIYANAIPDAAVTIPTIICTPV